MCVSPLDKTWKVKWKVQKCWIHNLLLLLNSEASNSTLDHVMTSLTVPEETRPKEISSQTTQMFFIPSLFLVKIITSYGFLIALLFW